MRVPVRPTGMDAQIGNKGAGPDPRRSPSAATAPTTRVPLFDTSYNRDLLPGPARRGVYGASMRMRVTGDEWDDKPARSDANPDGIPEADDHGDEGAGSSAR